MAGFFERLRNGLSRTRDAVAGKVDQLLRSYPELDDDFYEDLTDVLIMSDAGRLTASSSADHR